MLKVDIIDCKTKSSIVTFLFASSIASKSIISENISIFEDLNICQLELSKKYSQFNNLLTIWWGDLKTKVQMLSIQAYRVGIDPMYNCYQYIFP